MRTLLLVASASLLISQYGWAQQKAAATAPVPSGMECVAHLETPEFPTAALEAHVDGSVWTWVTVTPQGTADKIETQVVSAWGKAPQMLTPAVEKALHDTKFKPDCAGKRVAVVFRYELHGEPTPNPQVTSKTESPNIVNIESQPQAVTSAKNNTQARH